LVDVALGNDTPQLRDTTGSMKIPEIINAPASTT